MEESVERELSSLARDISDLAEFKWETKDDIRNLTRKLEELTEKVDRLQQTAGELNRRTAGLMVIGKVTLGDDGNGGV